MTAIRVDGLSKRFGTVTALDGLSLEIAEGELYGLLGPNGAGKTTTIEILTGQTRPDDGTARVIGIDPINRPVEVRRRVGILPEKESPPSLMTPREYLRFSGDVRDIAEDRVDVRIHAWANRLGFVEKLDTLSTDLSRGQQQKVMIAAAFLHDPAVVFIDEPLANLDPIVQERVKRFLREYREAGNTVLLSTHDVAVAGELCSRVGILDGGRFVDEVRPADLGPGSSLLDEFFDRIDSAARAETIAHG